jgi:hypothetical protein
MDSRSINGQLALGAGPLMDVEKSGWARPLAALSVARSNPAVPIWQGGVERWLVPRVFHASQVGFLFGFPFLLVGPLYVTL